MELNIQAIAEAKIQEMHDSGKIVAAIESGIESLIMKSVDSALNGFELKRSIEKQISESVSYIAEDIGFSAYNGFIAEKVKEITEGVLRADVALKVQKVFEDILIARHDGIKLSEIVDKYRQYLFDHVDDQDKWDKRHFTCCIDERQDGNFTHIDVVLSEEPKRESIRNHADIMLSFCFYGDKKEDDLISVLFSGHKLGDDLRLGPMTEIEALVANLYFNKTPIILDLDDVDDSNHYDIAD